jgi:hypothetical protein
MPTFLRHRYYDLSSSELREVNLDEFLRGRHGRYASVKITIHDGEDAQVEITPPSNHWLHSPKLLRALEQHLYDTVMMNRDGDVVDLNDEHHSRH